MAQFSSILKQLRTQHGYTQPELAAKLGISRSAISMYERGEREPDSETMEAIANLFHVDMNYLYGMSGPTFDDFTYALHNESRELNEENQQKLLEMARLFKLAHQHTTDQP